MTPKRTAAFLCVAIFLSSSFAFAQTSSSQGSNRHVVWLSEKGIMKGAANEGLNLSQDQIQAINALNQRSALESYKVLFAARPSRGLSPTVTTSLHKIELERVAALRKILTPEQNATLNANLARASKRPRP
jgi:Spy/CpxP family protein refolding chaperone